MFTATNKLFYILILAGFTASQANAAISIDRTRVILMGDEKSAQVNIINHSKKLPYLAQSWLENEREEKINSPLTVLPPLQRLEKDTTVQVNITSLPATASLPKDRESLFFYNLQEIPPKSDKANVIQLALKIKIKVFYRPESLKKMATEVWQEKLQLTPSNAGLKIVNPTPFYIVIPIVNVANKSVSLQDDAITLPPLSEVVVPKAPVANQAVQIQYINDYGSYNAINYQCTVSECTMAKDSKKHP
ncbi:fimbrial biogenesis chaperone [Serratia fonticola]|uniref:Fimbria/pilus periplasmic chaperone n=1 Tax=Serratia fonticola TaxID=47917 RepID=A0ABY9PRL7_SERFO|nr:fimbria/pilus periplasmic chaperone [Serratia fonticola]WMT15815.1 fimbria/pilus periplasmic chaperone [Serratia fonticola]